MRIETHKNFQQKPFRQDQPRRQFNLLVHASCKKTSESCCPVMSGDMNPAACDLEFSNSGTCSRENQALRPRHMECITDFHRSWHAVSWPRHRSGRLIFTFHATGKTRRHAHHHRHSETKVRTQPPRCLRLQLRQPGRNAVVIGLARVLAPAEKMRTRRVDLPDITISDKYSRLQALVARAKGLPAIDMAPLSCYGDLESLKGALMSAEAGAALSIRF